MSFSSQQFEANMSMTQELRRRWSDRTDAIFSSRDECGYQHRIAAEDFERDVDFQDCEAITFIKGNPTGRETDVLLMAQGSGYMALPPGVQVVVNGGCVKCTTPGLAPVADAASSRSAYSGFVASRAPPSTTGSSSGPGARPPPPTPVSTYARSYADSGYRSVAAPRSVLGAGSQASQGSASTHRPSPAGSSYSGSQGGGSYASARDAPPPRAAAPSVAGSSANTTASGFRIVEQASWFSDFVRNQVRDRARDSDACSITPSMSISSVGSRSSHSRN